MSNVFIGLSGGVDSSVAAALLQRDGHKVVGVFMKNWSGVTAGVKCPWEDDYASAKQVAAHLGIELKLYDFEKKYRQTVGKYLIDTYAAGLTPNPDIMCNEEIKFKAFFDRCLEEGADFIATGHYARIKNGQLYRGVDRNKDQSYFLYRVSQQALAKTLFPVGGFVKPKIRALAAEFGLPNAKRKDSVGICFVGEVPIKDFLHEFIEYKTGDVLDEAGKKVGVHDGVFFYTIGQRHGLGIGGGEPYFVYNKDVEKNILFVTTDPESDLLNKTTVIIADCIWHENPLEHKDYEIQARYRSAGKKAKLTLKSAGNYEVKLSSPERAIASGQSIVVYDGEQVLGGGIINT